MIDDWQLRALRAEDAADRLARAIAHCVRSPAGALRSALNHYDDGLVARYKETPDDNHVTVPKRAGSAGWDTVMALVAAQAEDPGLWFMAETAAEAYVQQELRRLHAAIEAAMDDDAFEGR